VTLPPGQHGVDGFPRFGTHLHRPPPAVPTDPAIKISGARGIRSEVEVGIAEGLPAPRVISCDNLITIPLVSLDDHAVGHLDIRARADLDRALRYALDIQY